MWSFAGKISNVAVVEGFAEGSNGLWNNKCAIDRSMGLVSVSISINPAHLSTNMKIIRGYKYINDPRLQILNLQFTRIKQLNT